MSEPRPPVAPSVAPPAYPTFPPPQYPPPPRRWRWPLVAGATAVGAVVAATTATVITANTVGKSSDTAAPATITVTAQPSAAQPKPAPLPAADADRRTCQAWVAAGDRIHAASKAQSVIPQGMTILDPAVRDNPDWTAAVRKAADLYGQAADTLSGGIAPGTTTILNQTATAAAASLQALSTAVATFDPANGNTYHVVHESADTMDVLCNRLAPR